MLRLVSLIHIPCPTPVILLTHISISRINELFCSNGLHRRAAPIPAGAGNTLSPPIIVDKDAGLIEIDVFATAVLCDTEGYLLTEHLIGTLVASEEVIEEYGTRKIVFIFHELAVRHPGKYTVRVDIYKMNDHAAEMVTQTETRIFSICDVPSEMPSKLVVPAFYVSERTMLVIGRR